MIGDKMKQLPVKQLMTRKLITVGPDATMKEVEDVFLGQRIHHIPVVRSDGELIGILGRREYYILLDQFSLFQQKNVERINEKFFNSILVKEVMKQNPIDIAEDATLKDVYAVFRENLIHALPVTDKNHKLVGIITVLDMLNFAFGEETHLLQEGKVD